MPIEGHSRNDIIGEIVNGSSKKCGIKGEISNLKYHRLNRGSVGQEDDDLEKQSKISENHYLLQN